RRGVAVLPPDINRSAERYLVEDLPGGAGDGEERGRGGSGAGRTGIRVSLRQVKGMQARALEAILKAREEGGPFTGLADFCRRCCPPVPRDIVEALILVGAFDSLDPNRRRLLWELPLVLAGRAGPGLFGDGPPAATSRGPGGGPGRKRGDV
ncbi:MAG TPA: error-prone DNA polymerase, partial [Clostridiales bacterium]|nr:error-prone DNA polymerase [Clostridiales bacterium]